MNLPASAWVCAGVTNGLEHVLPAVPVVPPALRLKDQSPLGAVGHNEAVDYVVDLASVPTPLVGGEEEEGNVIVIVFRHPYREGGVSCATSGHVYTHIYIYIYICLNVIYERYNYRVQHIA